MRMEDKDRNRMVLSCPHCGYKIKKNGEILKKCPSCQLKITPILRGEGKSGVLKRYDLPRELMTGVEPRGIELIEYPIKEDHLH
jgi:hypothetical protein